MLFPEPSERLLFREWKDDDVEPFVWMNRDPVVMEFFPSVLSRRQTLESISRIRKHFDDFGFGLYALEKKETAGFIGFTGFAEVRFESFFSPCMEIGWRLQQSEWGKGYATEAAIACLKFGFASLGFKRICSFTSVLNNRSEKVMKKTGMIRFGEFEHPLIPLGNPLRTHVLYQSIQST